MISRCRAAAQSRNLGILDLNPLRDVCIVWFYLPQNRFAPISVPCLFTEKKNIKLAYNPFHDILARQSKGITCYIIP